MIPPQTDIFTVRKLKYPSADQGSLAPGMSLKMSVTFSSPSFADFDDFITFITEDNSFKVPLRARRDPPSINLVNPMDCLNSWLGDRVDMAFRCVNNGGDGGFKFFCEKDEDDSKQTDPDSIKIGSFTLTPSEFYLYSGNAIDIYVSFNPEQEGSLSENLILACDNQTSEFYKLTGFGAMLDLEIIAVDGKPVDFKKNPFETIYFENTNPTSESKRTITLKNSSAIQVAFHWSVFRNRNTNTITLTDEQTHYRVTPNAGKIAAGETQEFSIFFSPDHAEPYFEFADLIVEDIPINAVRNPPDGLKTYAAANSAKTKVPMPMYIGSNTQFMSIPMAQFNLRGQGNSCKVEVHPPIAIFEGDCFIGKQYTETISLKKLSQGKVKYSLRLLGKNTPLMEVDLRTQGKSLSGAQNGILEGVISDSDSIDMQIIISNNTVGTKAEAYFYLDIEDGSPVSFSCTADFRGPLVTIQDPIIDFGLAKVNTSKEHTICLKNASPIPANYILKNAKNKKLSFSNAVSDPERLEQEMALVKKRTSTNLVLGRNLQTSGKNDLKFSHYHGTIQPNQSLNVTVHMDCLQQESVQEFFEIMVQNSNSVFIEMLAEIQEPRVRLNREEVNLGKIYAGVREVVTPEAASSKHFEQCVEIENYGNIPAKFNWHKVNDQSKIIANFQPSSGVIKPKQKVKISFETTVFTGGHIDELFLCDIEDMELPVGFELKADAFGLNVAYLTHEDQSMASTTTSFNTRASPAQSPRETKNDMLNGMNRLQILNFPSCVINKPINQKFVLKNLSGIRSKFKFTANNFEPIAHVAPINKSEIQRAAEQNQNNSNDDHNSSNTMLESKKQNKNGKQIRFSLTMRSSNNMAATKQRTQPILSDVHEQTQKFSSATGNTFTQTKQFEKDQNFYLSNNKGIAIVMNPHEGELPPNSEVPVTVTIYNNVCGKFDDNILANVEGLGPVTFPVRMNISGSPVVLPNNQVGLNYNTVPATLPMPTIVDNTNPISKTFKIKNTGIKSVQVDWSIFDRQDLNKVGNDAFKLNIVKNFSFDHKMNPYKFNFQAIEPAESTDSVFEINPKQITVQPRSQEQFTVTFHPVKGVGQFNSILLASPVLSAEELEISSKDEQPQKGALGIISLNLMGNTIRPQLSLDKSIKLDGEKHFKMRYWSVPNEQDAPNQVQKLIFTNNTKADLTFNLNLTGPFEIVKTKSNTGAKHPLQSTPTKVVKKKVETMFQLQPLKIVEVSVKFLTPQPSNNEEWPMTMNNKRQGEVLAHFSNGEQQKIFITGVLMRPKVVLLTEKPSKNEKAMDELDFGTCNVDMHRTIKLYLSNITEVTAKWQLNYIKFPNKATIGHNTTTPWEQENMEKTDEPDVFEFNVTEGSLRGKSIPLRKMPEGLSIPPVPKDEFERQFMPQVILINFRPKKNILYKSKFRFTVANGISCDVILKGKGSYEEDKD